MQYVLVVQTFLKFNFRLKHLLLAQYQALVRQKLKRACLSAILKFRLNPPTRISVESPFANGCVYV